MRPSYLRPDREPTGVFRVMDVLRRLDDFLTPGDIAAASSLSLRDVTKTLHYLEGYAQAVAHEEQGGERYYYLTGADRRIKTFEVRKKEPPGNRGGRVAPS